MPPDWPTGPLEQAPAPQPPSYDVPDLHDEPTTTAPLLIVACPDPDCWECRVARVGASTICQLVGVDYLTLPPEAQRHYEHVASEVMAAMSAALIEWGVAVPTQETP